MAGVVHIPWYATGFRADRLEAALAEISAISMRYGATYHAVHRNRDDRYKFLQIAAFDDKKAWTRYWEGPEFIRFRTVTSSWYQVPVLYTWADLVTEGSMLLNAEGNGIAGEDKTQGAWSHPVQ
jgi:hypothetical protein